MVLGSRKQLRDNAKVKHHLFIIMTLPSSQRAALRAKKAITDGNTNFKPRGEKNKTDFEALKKQAPNNSNDYYCF